MLVTANEAEFLQAAEESLHFGTCFRNILNTSKKTFWLTEPERDFFPCSLRIKEGNIQVNRGYCVHSNSLRSYKGDFRFHPTVKSRDLKFSVSNNSKTSWLASYRWWIKVIWLRSAKNRAEVMRFCQSRDWIGKTHIGPSWCSSWWYRVADEIGYLWSIQTPSPIWCWCLTGKNPWFGSLIRSRSNRLRFGLLHWRNAQYNRRQLCW